MEKESELHERLLGVWKLDYFEHAEDGAAYQYSDILMFSKKYYSNFQADRGDPDSSRCHMGMYKLSNQSISFQIQLSNKQDAIGSVATGKLSFEKNILKIIFEHGALPGVWIYKRLIE
jgi:hypothetical protein